MYKKVGHFIRPFRIHSFDLWKHSNIIKVNYSIVTYALDTL